MAPLYSTTISGVLTCTDLSIRKVIQCAYGSCLRPLKPSAIVSSISDRRRSQMSNTVCYIRALRRQSCRRVRPSLYPNLGSSVLLMMASSTQVVGVRSLGFLLDPSPKGSLKQWRTRLVGAPTLHEDAWEAPAVHNIPHAI